MQTAPKNLPELVSWVRSQQLSLQLMPEKIAFLMSIASLHEHQIDGAFREPELIDIFRVVQLGFSDQAAQVGTRANSAINELVQQRIMNRFLGDWSDPDSFYRLTPLGLSIATHYLRQQDFSALRLSLQLKQVARVLAAVAEAVEQRGSIEIMQNLVFAPLKYSVAEIFDSIDQTQRELDVQQQVVRSQISDLLSQRWIAAIGSCEKLLDETSLILRELRDVLEAVGYGLQSTLLRIQRAVLDTPEFTYIQLLVQDLQRKLDRILLWGERGIELWIRYDRHVHRFIRAVIDFDKNRALTQRLKQSVGQYAEAPWFLTLCQADRLLDYDETLPERQAGPVVGSLPEPMVLRLVADHAEQRPTRAEVIACFAEPIQTKVPCSLAAILTQYLIPFPVAQHHELTQRFLTHVMDLGLASTEFLGHAVVWHPINPHGLAVQAHDLDNYEL